jgi:hypothetical protein
MDHTSDEEFQTWLSSLGRLEGKSLIDLMRMFYEKASLDAGMLPLKLRDEDIERILDMDEDYKRVVGKLVNITIEMIFRGTHEHSTRLTGGDK